MKALRPKQADWGKPFKIFQKKEDFIRLDEPDPDLIISRAKIEKKPEPKKEEIIKPRIEIVSAPGKSSNTSGIPLNYIRLTAELNLPRADKYELSEVDFIFLTSNEGKFLFGGKKVLTVELLERCFVELEIMTGRDFSTIPKALKSRFKTFLEAHLDVMSKMERFDEMVDLIYNRWRSRRDELKNPLLRQLWRPLIDDTSHFLAFRPRQKDKEKRHLRRIHKSNEDETKLYMEGLLKEVEKSQELVERVIARQKFKLGLYNMELQRFNIEAQSFKEQPLFVQELDKKQITTLRQNYQTLKNEFQAQKQTVQLESVIEATSATAEDTKAEICNFVVNLSSLANEAGIDWETLYGRVVAPIPPAPLPPPVDPRPTPIVVIPPLINNTVVKFNLKEIHNKQQAFLEKSFRQNYQESKPERFSEESNPYFTLKQRNVCINYFFDEDDEEARDVKKSIAVAFKKYMVNKT